MKERQALAQQFLISTLDAIKQEEKIEGFAYMWLEVIIDISFLNGFEELMEEALQLRTSPKKHGHPLIGAITNILKPNTRPVYDWPKTKEELEKKYTYNNVIDFLKLMENSGSGYLILKNPNQLEAAIRLAKDDYELELIACSLCVHGHFEVAQKMIDKELSKFPHRIHVVNLVRCIELFRKNEFHKAKAMLDLIYPEKKSNWDNLILARGILGYQAWGGYPFSDY
ncbi:MAG: hypothetical protein AAF587_25195 [Bacteroidota bacterium]